MNILQFLTKVILLNCTRTNDNQYMREDRVIPMANPFNIENGRNSDNVHIEGNRHLNPFNMGNGHFYFNIEGNPYQLFYWDGSNSYLIFHPFSNNPYLQRYAIDNSIQANIPQYEIPVNTQIPIQINSQINSTQVDNQIPVNTQIDEINSIQANNQIPVNNQSLKRKNNSSNESQNKRLETGNFIYQFEIEAFKTKIRNISSESNLKNFFEGCLSNNKELYLSLYERLISNNRNRSKKSPLLKYQNNLISFYNQNHSENQNYFGLFSDLIFEKQLNFHEEIPDEFSKSKKSFIKNFLNKIKMNTGKISCMKRSIFNDTRIISLIYDSILMLKFEIELHNLILINSNNLTRRKSIDNFSDLFKNEFRRILNPKSKQIYNQIYKYSERKFSLNQLEYPFGDKRKLMKGLFPGAEKLVDSIYSKLIFLNGILKFLKYSNHIGSKGFRFSYFFQLHDDSIYFLMYSMIDLEKFERLK